MRDLGERPRARPRWWDADRLRRGGEDADDGDRRRGARGERWARAVRVPWSCCRALLSSMSSSVSPGAGCRLSGAGWAERLPGLGSYSNWSSRGCAPTAGVRLRGLRDICGCDSGSGAKRAGVAVLSVERNCFAADSVLGAERAESLATKRWLRARLRARLRWVAASLWLRARLRARLR